MKIIYKLFIALFVSSIILTGCEDMLEVKSERFVELDNYSLSSANDTLKSLVGIYTKLQTIGERYVLLGELRGDLMDITDNANTGLRQIRDFTITPDNQYIGIKDYYAVINNCNFLTSKLDTNIVLGGKRLVYREYAAIKAVRAWVYLQIALNYGKAVYYDVPLENVSDAGKVYPEYDLNQLAPFLIKDLLPLKDIESPIYGLMGKVNTNRSFIPVRFLLGELYLWTGDYKNAANEYRDLLFNKYCATNIKSDPTYTPPYDYRPRWNVVNGIYIDTYNRWRNDIISYNVTGVLSEIITTSEFGEGFNFTSMTWPYNFYTYKDVMIKPSDIAIENWDKQDYFDNADPLNTKSGDLRGYYNSYMNDDIYYSGTSSSVVVVVKKSKSTVGMNNYIRKYFANGSVKDKFEYITTCRSALVYLRYAEAVNRLGKPNLAFAVLKYGLNRFNLLNPNIVPKSELTPKENFTDFDDDRFSNNIGIHALGCGYVEKSNKYIIPLRASQPDSIEAVEDLIVEELALETAFEGNRFYDLMRVSLRRGGTDYLANKIAQKRPELLGTLKEIKNWYLPIK